MRTVRFDPSTLAGEEAAWWMAWTKRAELARKDLLAQWEAWLLTVPPAGQPRPPFKPAFNQSVWSDLKHWLNQHVFLRMCAYCEAPLMFDRSQGDAEHFRPKGSVKWIGAGAEQRAFCPLDDGLEIPHPGYFWLAYEWQNLVPACSFCNAGNGKVDQFPVRNRHVFRLDAVGAGYAPDEVPPIAEAMESPSNSKRYFLAPNRLDALESPLLLNPLNPAINREPREHLRYGVGGTVVAVDDSEIGANSIAVYKLEREDLRSSRQAEQERAHRDYFVAYSHPVRGVQDAREVEDEYKLGRKYFPSAALDYLEERRRVLAARSAGEV